MTTEIDEHMERSAELIVVGEELIVLGYWSDVVSRAYYSMFHAATAVLLHLGIERRSHHALISAFGEHVAKAGIMKQDYHRYLLDAFSARSESDYLPRPETTEEEATVLLTKAREFINAAKECLKA